MLQKFRVAALLTLALAVTLAVGTAAQSRWNDRAHDVQVWGTSTTAFATQTATGATPVTVRVNAKTFTTYLLVTGGPSGCTYRLQGSIDGTNWFNIDASDITCTSSIATFEVDKPAVYIRGNLLTLSGGTSPTVTLQVAAGN